MKQKFYTYLITGLVLITAITGCQTVQDTGAIKSAAESAPGPRNLPVDTSDYPHIYYVSAGGGSDTDGSGKRNAPWESLSFALRQAERTGKPHGTAVLVASGNYAEPTLQLPEGCDLYGGFSRKTWVRDSDRYASVIDGNGRQRLLIAADGCRIDGFIFTGGRIRGKGGAILCDGVSAVITNNRFIDNKTLGPSPWQPAFWHETANDGGALYCTGGAAPIIQNNYFYRNRTENGRGAAIACDNHCRPEIAGNVFLDNHAGTDDPMRSSDGGAVSVFNRCDADIRGNVFLSNTADASNDGGGIFLALWSSARIEKNIFVDNEAADDAGALFVGGQEHRYDAPLDPLPPAGEFFVTIEDNMFIGNRNRSMNSGAMRFTMESRGAFKRNIVAQNNGIYFQRSEVLIENNTILDNFLFVETKEGLVPGTISENLIWGEFVREAPASVRHNNLKPAFADSLNYSQPPVFEEDGIRLDVFSASFFPKKGYSEVYPGRAKLIPGELVNRIVRTGDRWGVVKSNDENGLVVWGEFSAISELTILPTYTPKL